MQEQIENRQDVGHSEKYEGTSVDIWSWFQESMECRDDDGEQSGRDEEKPDEQDRCAECQTREGWPHQFFF